MAVPHQPPEEPEEPASWGQSFKIVLTFIVGAAIFAGVRFYREEQNRKRALEWHQQIESKQRQQAVDNMKQWQKQSLLEEQHRRATSKAALESSSKNKH